MKRRHVLLLAGAGLVATAGAVVVAVVGVGAVSPWGPTAAEPGSDPDAMALLVALVAFVVGVWLLWDRSSGDGGDDQAPQPGPGPIHEGTPEATSDRHPLTGGALVEALADAGAVAREDRDVEAGVAVVRPVLREAYRDLRVHEASGTDPAAELDAGTWTEDPVAAAVLSGEVPPPTRSLGQRLRDWLYPGRAVTRRVARAVDALAAVAEESVPPVVGQSAPRQVQVHEPSLAARTVGADGEYPTLRRPGEDGTDPNAADADGDRDPEPGEGDDGGEDRREVSRS